jgi:AcrR family transcriptional regulator
VGVADIARRAGVGTATIFRRFPTKDDLVAVVLETRLQAMTEIARDRDRGFMENVGKRAFADDPRFAAATEQIFASLDRIVAGARNAGELRDDAQTARPPGC